MNIISHSFTAFIIQIDILWVLTPFTYVGYYGHFGGHVASILKYERQVCKLTFEVQRVHSIFKPSYGISMFLRNVCVNLLTTIFQSPQDNNLNTRTTLYSILFLLCVFFFNGSTAPWGPRPPHFSRLHDHTH
jgi:hypothetical protein